MRANHDPNEEQQAEVAANRKRYEQLKAAGAGPRAEALPPPTPRDGAPSSRRRSSIARSFPAAGTGRTRLNSRRGAAHRQSSGKACVSLLAWNAADPSERLNHADTIKVQWAASLRKGRVILSDMGRVLLSVIQDTSGAHDALAGGSNAATNAARYRRWLSQHAR